MGICNSHIINLRQEVTDVLMSGSSVITVEL
jgi:hypothetical protein